MPHDNVPCMQHSWNPAQEGQGNVDKQVRAAASANGYRERRNEDGDDTEYDAFLMLCQKIVYLRFALTYNRHDVTLRYGRFLWCS